MNYILSEEKKNDWIFELENLLKESENKMPLFQMAVFTGLLRELKQLKPVEKSSLSDLSLADLIALRNYLVIIYLVNP